MPLDFSLSHAEFSEVRGGALIVPEETPVFRVEGPGALDCLQGLLTCDLVAAGDASLSYGAMLTPKGMIIVDLWVLREAGALQLLLPPGTRELAAGHLARVLPPRLARVTDLTDAWSSAWLLGDRALEPWAAASGGPAPAGNRLARPQAFPDVRVGSGSAEAPFRALLLGPREAVAAAGDALRSRGMKQGSPAALAAARVLAGWPTLGREIDEKTIPQEVRYDELGGAVSYAKGCFTGQETVARVHFRGQVNRMLRGVELPPGAIPAERTLSGDGKPRGALRTALLLADGVLGLASVRRECEPGARLRLGDREARLVALPFPALVAG